MPMFIFRGFTVKITKTKKRYRYAGDNGTHHVASPKPGSKEPLFPTSEQARYAALNEIFCHIAITKFCELPLGPQTEIGLVIERVHSSAWKLGPYDIVCFVDCRESNRRRNSR